MQHRLGLVVGGMTRGNPGRAGFLGDLRKPFLAKPTACPFQIVAASQNANIQPLAPEVH
jgi:hypothetical protein